MREESSSISTETARPVAAPGTRCLLLQLEPTPYILPRALYVYRDPGLHAELFFTYVNQSQSWGSDADIGDIPVLLDPAISKYKQGIRVVRLMGRILRGDFTVAHLAGWGHWLVRLAILCCRMKSVPFSLESDTQLAKERHGPREWLKKEIYPVLFRWAGAVVPGGSRQADLFRYYGVEDEKIFVSHMTTDIEKLNKTPSISRDDFRAGNSIAKDDVVVLYVGRLESYKGVSVLLDSFRAGLQRDSRLVLAIAGEGTLLNEVKRFGETLPAGRVRILGRQPLAQVVQWMRSSEMLVLPSLREQWGMVVNEAMTCGLPVIVSDACGCVDDLVFEGKNGYVFQSGNAEACAERIVVLARDPALRARMASEAKKIIEPWVIERQAETIRSVLCRLSYTK